MSNEVRNIPMVNGMPVAARSEFPIRRIIAVVAQLASYMTTLWAVQWVWNDGLLHYQVLAAVVVEVVLVGMKSALWGKRNGDHTIGWAGFVIDTATNVGGILPRAGRLLTWPPVATLLGVFSVNSAEPAVQTAGGFTLALLFGILLSVLPHRLWRG